MKNENVRCAVIGIGTMGKKYAVMLGGGKINGLILTAVCCRSESSAEWARANLSNSVAIFQSEDELFAHSQLFDAVIIVTPHRLHPQASIRAFNLGKHVMCDKPAGITALDAERINSVATVSGKVYAMMCQQRTYSHHQLIKRILDEGAIGKLSRVSLISSGYFRTQFYHHSADWRSSWRGEGGGALINQGYHLLDLWQYLFGLPTSVYAVIPFGKYNDFAVDDEATVVMEYPDKLTGTFILTTGEGADAERFEIVGTKGRILLTENSLVLTVFDVDTREYSATAQVTSRQELSITEKQFKLGDTEAAYELMLENFAGAILRGDALYAPGVESANTLRLVNAAYLSAWKGQKVNLPVNAEEYLSLLRSKELEESVKRR